MTSTRSQNEETRCRSWLIRISPMPRLLHQIVEDGQHCVLHGDVERGGGFVGDQEIGLGDQHHGDHDALAHAAGELVRIEVVDPFGIADVHRLEHLQRRARGPRCGCCADGGDASRRSAGRPSSPDSASISGPAGPSRCAGRAGVRNPRSRGRAGRCRRRRSSSASTRPGMGNQAQDGAAGGRLAGARIRRRCPAARGPA